MADLSAIRARLKDRQVKEGALGTAESSICLDLSLLDELAELEQAKSAWMAAQPLSDGQSLAGGAEPSDETPMDESIEAKRQEIREASLRVVFKAVSSVRYQGLLNQFEDPEEKDQAAFLSALAEACLTAVWSESDKLPISWEELKQAAGFAEYDEMLTKVLVLNRRRQDVPFSLKPSKQTVSSNGTSKPV